MGTSKKKSDKTAVNKIFNYKSPDDAYLEKGVF
jgi:hypothetical protein